MLKKVDFVVCPVILCNDNSGGVVGVGLLRDFGPLDDFGDEVDFSSVGVAVVGPLCVEGMSQGDKALISFMW